MMRSAITNEGETRFDLSKSLHHLAAHGFDVSRIKRHSQAELSSSPLRNHHIAPDASPPKAYPLSNGHNMVSPESVDDFPSERNVVERTSSAASSSSSAWSDECHFLNTSTYPEGASTMNASPSKRNSINHSYDEGSFYSEDDVFPLKVFPFSVAPQINLRATIDLNESDAVEVTLDPSYQQVAEELNFPSPRPPLGVQNPGDHNEQISILTPSPQLTKQIPSLSHQSPQTPVRLNFCGMPDWCEPSTACGNSSFLLEDKASLQRSPVYSSEGLCKVTCGNDHVLDDNNITQHAVQSRICSSLGMDVLCQPWQSLYPNKSPGQPSPTQPDLNSDDGKADETMKRRVISASARRTRLASLRRDLNPFYDNAPKTHHRYPLCKSQSFNEAAVPKPSLKKREIRAASVWECESLDCVAPSDQSLSPVTIKRQWEEEFLGYDSDPEVYYGKENDVVASGSCHGSTAAEGSTTVTEFINERFTFILHSDKSVAVHAWIERGQQLLDRWILPKLVWKPINQSGTNKQSELAGIDILDICRVLPVILNRDKHPFAAKDSLVAVTSVSGEQIIFEARSSVDRDRWMNLLKMTVSTLAAKFLTRDPTVLGIFFAVNDLVHPGELPLQFQEQQKQEAWV